MTFQNIIRRMSRMSIYTMKELPASERPYEKLELYGEKSLSNAELIAIVVKTGTRNETSLEIAQKIIKESVCEGNSLNLANISLSKLQKIDGIGRVKAITLKAVFELANRVNNSFDDRIFLGSKNDAAKYIMGKLRNEKQEKFVMLGLDIKSRLMKFETLAIGQLNQVDIKPREILRSALECGCASIIIAHNHPSGDTTPSMEDVTFTVNLLEIGRMMDFNIFDHIIVGNGQFTSLRDKKYITGW